MAAPDLAFATDEDTYLNPDPRINLFDLGDPLDFAKSRIKLVRTSLNQLQDRVVAKGEGWQRARAAFGTLLRELMPATYSDPLRRRGVHLPRPPRRSSRPAAHEADRSGQAARSHPPAPGRDPFREGFSVQAGAASPFGPQPMVRRPLGIARLPIPGASAGPRHPAAGRVAVSWTAATLHSLQEISLHAEPGQKCCNCPRCSPP